MQPLNLLSSLFAFFALAVAIPAASPADLVPRACSTRSPTIYQISAAAPNDIVVAGSTRVERTGPPYQDSVSTVLSFNGFPDGATGCQLTFTIPKSNVAVATANPDYSGAFQADVWLVKARGPPSWNTSPFKQQMVSTLQFPTKPTTSVYSTIVWAGNCPSNNVPRDGPYASQIQFLIEGSTWQQLAGTANLYNSVGGNSVGAASGFTIVYNC